MSNELSIETLQEKIDAIFDELTPAQQKATIYIRKKWEQICMMTAKEVGQKAEVSEATIQRIAVCLGFQSFRDMKTQLKSILKKRAVVNFNLKKEQGHNEERWIDEHINSEVMNIMQSVSQNDNRVFENGAKTLLAARRIWVMGDKMGSGASAYLCFSLNYLIGKTVRINLSDCSEYLSSMDENDVLVVIGFQRYCKRTLKAAELAKKNGAKVIAFTDCDLSPFAKLSDTAFFAQTDSIIFLDSYSSVLSLAHALLAKVVKLGQDVVEQHIKKNEDAYTTLL